MSYLETSNSIIEIIKKRYSSRTYSKLQINSELKNQIIEYIQKERKSPFQGKVRFELLELDPKETKTKKKFGTYGFIKGAENYIIGIIEETKYDLENFGYLFEEIILFITKLGLGTCWIGGTFKHNEVADLLSCPLTVKEKIPAITPVGIPTKGTILRDKIIKKAVRSRKRKEWSTVFFNKDFGNPLSYENARKYIIPLEMVRIAPSSANTQPWRIIKERNEDIFHFYLFRKKTIIRQIISRVDFSRIDLGIAVCHFDLVTKYLCINGEWIFKQPRIEQLKNLEYVISWISKH